MSADPKKAGVPLVPFDSFQQARAEAEARAAEIGDLKAKISRRDAKIGQMEDQLRQAEERAGAARAEFDSAVRVLRDEIVQTRARAEADVAAAKTVAKAEAQAEIERAKSEMQDVIDGARTEVEAQYTDRITALEAEIEARKAETAEIHRRLCNGIADGEGVYWANKAETLQEQLAEAEVRMAKLSERVAELLGGAA